MTIWHSIVLTVAFTAHAVAAVPLAFEGAEGFGAGSRGGTDGAVHMVTRLDDDAEHPPAGSLRWAVNQKGPRIVRFAVAGNIRLEAALVVKEPFLTIDGGDAPGDGICICDHSLCFFGTHDVIVRHIRIRLGDVGALAAVEKAGLPRPKGSFDLDCISAEDSKNLIFDHCSLSWSCDELLCFVRCENVTVQWCILAEPLANPRTHPYGDRHAFGPITSADTLSLHHCLVAHYVMRGPQFEANDVRRSTGYDVRMEAVNNVLFDYERSGSRYTTGIQDHPEEAANTRFQFQFINNYYLNPEGRQPEIAAVVKHGVVDRVQTFVSGNLGPHRPSDDLDQLACVFTEDKQPIAKAPAEVRAQLVPQRLFTPAVSVTTEKAESALARVLEQAGCGPRRDAVDQRIVDDVKQRRYGQVLKSQSEVGGWPELK